MANLGRRMYSLLEGNQGANMAFVVGPEKVQVPADISVLAANSEVFATMYLEPRGSDLGDSRISHTLATLILPFSTPEGVGAFVKGIYLDEVDPKLRLEVLIELLGFCHTFMVTSLLKRCEKVILGKITKDNCVYLMEMKTPCLQDVSKPVWNALLTCLKKNLKYCMCGSSVAIAGGSSTAYSFLVEWSAGTWDLVLDFEGPEMANVGEVTLFRQLLQWRNKDPSRQGEFQKLVRKVRFPLMSLASFTDIVVPHKVLSDEEVVNLICYIKMKAQGTPVLSMPFSVFNCKRRFVAAAATPQQVRDQSSIFEVIIWIIVLLIFMYGTYLAELRKNIA